MISESQSILLNLLVDSSRSASSSEISSTEVDNRLKQIHFILHDQMKLLEASMELLDHERKKPVQEIIHDNSQRHFWKVLGSKDNEYLCFEKFCTCQSYQQLLKSSYDDQPILCKHLLSIRIAKILGLVEKVSLPLDQFMEKMCQDAQIQSADGNARFSSFASSFIRPH